MDILAMNFDDFGPQTNFFPCFPCVAGKMSSPWAAPFWRANSVITDPADGVYDCGGRDL
jgi:hypothetical protein